MKLIELQPPPKPVRDYKVKPHEGFISQWTKDIDALLLQNGYKLLGRGSFGRVYKNYKQNKVLKAFIKDTGFMTWVRFCRNNPNNPWLPKFKSNFIRLKQEPPVYGVLIEELQPNDNAEIAYLLAYLASEYPKFFTNSTINLEAVRGSKLLLKYESFIQQSYDENFDTMLKFLYAHEDMIDISNENIMKRGNQYVITDPLA